MRSPKPKTPPTPKTGGKSVWSEHTLGKALDVAKQGTSTIASVAEVFSEVQRTKQKGIQGQVDIVKATEKTERVRLNAAVDIAGVVRDREKNAQDHDLAKTEALQRHELRQAEAADRRRLLDRMIESPNADPSLLVDGLHKLLPNDKG